LATPASAQITNPGFESGFEGWTIEGADKAVALSDEGEAGNHSAKLSATTGVIQQVITVSPNHHYDLTAQVKGAALLGVKIDSRIYFDRVSKHKRWKAASLKFNSGASDMAIIFASYNQNQGRLDEFEIEDKGAQGSQKLSHFILPKTSGGTGLSPTLPPSENFDLSNWYLSIPVDKNGDGKSDSIYETDLNRGYENKSFFYTGEDGGLVFRAPVSGAKTSKNTKYTRSELREMLRAGDTSISTAKPGKNNWVLSTASEKARKAAGAIGGNLKATLAINHVTTTGDKDEIGRFIIGQIHGWHNEPARLYYRLLPGHQKGMLYFAHEPQTREAKKLTNIYYPLIGDGKSNSEEPENGIKLGEKFSYEIDVTGTDLTISILQDQKVLATRTLDISDSNYEIDEEYLYFKAGAYNQNETGRPDDFVQATFYKIEASH